MAAKLDTLPKAFIWRRLHSLTGLWLVLFLIEHLVTNSQAALLVGESGAGFVRMVNALHNLPYLTVIEVTLLGVPIAIHLIWGIRYALTSKANSHSTDGASPSLKYCRNRAYTWQRITSWILAVLLIVHVVKFRFLEYPQRILTGASPTYYVKVNVDPGLYTVADRLDAKLYDGKAIERMQREPNHLQDIASVTLKQGQVVATTSNFGTASLLTVRDTFKNPIWVGVYTIFVLSACFHAFNGLWTSMLTWGWVIKVSAQTRARQIAVGLMILISLLGLAAVWGTYFVNLRT